MKTSNHRARRLTWHGLAAALAPLLLCLPHHAIATEDDPQPEWNYRHDPKQDLQLQEAARAADRAALRVRMSPQLAFGPRDIVEKDQLSAEQRAQFEAARKALESAQVEMERASREVAEIARRASTEALQHQLYQPAFSRAGIGVVLGPDSEAGVTLIAITPDSPADKAGLRSGDRLLSFNGTELDGNSPEERLKQIHDALSKLEVEQKIGLRYERDGKAGRVELTTQTLPGLVWLRDKNALSAETPRRLLEKAQSLVPLQYEVRTMDITPFANCKDDDCPLLQSWSNLRWRDLRLTELEGGLGRYFGTDSGALVLRAEGDELKPLQSGDVIKRIDGNDVTSPRQAMGRLSIAEPGDTIKLDILRDRKSRSVTLTAPAKRDWRLMMPPMPPQPPEPPAAPDAPDAPPAPPAPTSWNVSPPAPPPPAPSAPTAPRAPEAPRPIDGDGVLQRIIG